MHLFKYVLLLIIVTVTSCKKKEMENMPMVDQLQNGMLIINEGLFQQNTASLSWIDWSEDNVNNTFFEQKNERMLGDVANDILHYGGKLYITVSTSSTVEILDYRSGKSIHQINMIENGIPKQPRELKGYQGKIFVSCFDGFVDVFDTISFDLIQRIQIGSNPEAMMVKGNELFVSNTGGLNYPDVDSTISIINMDALTETRKLLVGKNPGPMQFDENGNLYVITSRANSPLNKQMVRLNADTYTMDTIYTMNITKLEKMGNKILVLESNYSTTGLHLFNCSTRSFELMHFIPSNQFTTLYNIQYDALRQQIMCFDAVSFTNLGFVNIYSANGAFINKKQVGLCPSKAIIYE